MVSAWYVISNPFVSKKSDTILKQTMYKTFDCLGIGLCTFDRLYLLEKYPGPNEKHVALESHECGGGPVANAIYALGLLGDKAAICSSIGDDYEGGKVITEFRNVGISVEYLKIVEGKKTPSASIWIDARNGDRTVVLDNSGSPKLNADDIPTEAVQNSRFILLDGRNAELCLKTAEIAHEAGNTIVYDLGSMRDNIDDILKSADIVIASKDFADAFDSSSNYKQIMGQFLDYGAECAVITLGADGWVWLDEKGGGTGKTFKVKVKDTTGAGDVFHGAFIHGLIRGWNVDNSCRFAGAAAALSCRVLRGRDGFHSEKEVFDLIKSG